MVTEEMLTAYALNETSEFSAADREALERHLTQNADARKYVDEVRSTAQELSEQFKSEAVVAGLAAAQKTTIAKAAGAREAAKVRARALSTTSWRVVALAASILMVVGVVGLLLPRMRQEKRAVLSELEKKDPVACKAFAEATETYRRTDYDSDGVREYSQRAQGNQSLLEKKPSGDDVALVDQTFGRAEGKAGTATPKSGYTFTVISQQGQGATGGQRQQDGQGRDQFIISNNGTIVQKDKSPSPVTMLRPRLDPNFPNRGNATTPAADRALYRWSFADKSKSEVEKLKKDIEDLRRRAGSPSVAAVSVDNEIGNKYGPNADVTRDGKAAASAQMQVGVVNALTVIDNNQPGNTEQYDPITDNAFQRVMQQPLSTFSIDVDTASYSLMRRNIESGSLPAPDSVRIEELINYFPYSYTAPKGDAADPFAANVEVAQCPWNPEHRLARIGIKGKEIEADKRPVSNLVFLVDVSGSMEQPNKLPLVQKSLKMLVDNLLENDHVALVVYAGTSGLVLDSTSCNNKAAIKDVIDRLRAGGSTNGAQGIQLAYDTAVKHFVIGGTNRVILCTDGDWNVGVTSDGDLMRLISDKAKTGVFLSVLGFGMGNYKDGKMEKMADKGNGNYAYIDKEDEAKKALVEQLSGTLVTIAKDVKIQVEFNPAKVSSYRLIGYENRILAAEDFNNDKKDAGEIGAGHTITALYEVVPCGKTTPPVATVDPLEYQVGSSLTDKAYSNQLMTLKIRYKQPDQDVSKLLKFPVEDSDKNYAKATPDFKFAAAVAAFGMVLRGSPYAGNTTMGSIEELATEAAGRDTDKYRIEFRELVKKTAELLKTRKIQQQELPVQEAPQPGANDAQPELVPPVETK